MAKQKVLISSCDRCSHEERTPLKDRGLGRRNTYVLPSGWIHIEANTETATLFELDLCKDCKRIVLEAAGAAQSARKLRAAT
jgi:hypothetical protein